MFNSVKGASRDAYRCIYVDESFYIIGGRGSEADSQMIYRLHTSTWTWSGGGELNSKRRLGVHLFNLPAAQETTLSFRPI